MLPPQAPPALVVSSQQDMLDTLQRLAGLQAWRGDIAQALPPLPDSPTAGERGDHLYRLAQFWHDPQAARTPALGAHLAAVMRDEALLRGFDGTLDERARDMAVAFARSTERSPPTPLQGHLLMVGGMPHAGSVVVTGAPDDPAIVFLPEVGWERFTDRQALLDAMEQRFRQAQNDGIEPPGVSLLGIDDAPSDRIVTLSALQGAPLFTLASVVIARQRERLDAAWSLLFDTTLSADERRLAIDAMRIAARLDMLPDVRRLISAHERRLLQKVTDERLAQAAPDVANDWRRSWKAYDDLQRVATNWTWVDLPNIETFAIQRLDDALRAIGATTPAGDVFVDIYSCGCQIPPTGRRRVYHFVKRVPLVELALENVPDWEVRQFAAVDRTGRSLERELTPDRVLTLIRDVDVAGHYARLIRTTFTGSIEADMRRALALGALTIRLRMDAEEARLSAHLSEDIPHLAGGPLHDAGYAWVDAMLDAPAARNRRKDGGHDIVAKQVTYKGVPVAGVFTLSSSSTYEKRIVAYTPGAPDGVVFREFTDRDALEREFLYALRFEDYLLERLPPRFATTAPNGVRRFDVSSATRLSRWVFGGMPAHNTTHTDEAFGERVVDGHLLEALYDAEVDLREAQVRLLARSSSEADADHFRLDPAAFARGFAHFIGRAPMAGWRFYDQVKQRDPAGAFVEFTAAYTALLDFGLLVALKPALAHSVIVRGAHRTLRLRLARVDLTTAADLFEARFAITCGKCARSIANAHGIHQVDGQNLIAHGGKMYAVQYDTVAQTWRLTRPDALDSHFTGPAVVHVGEGQWQYRTDLGLLGGSPPVGSTDALLRKHRHIEDLHGLNDAQIGRFARHLVAGKGSDAGAKKLAWRRIQRVPLTTVERQRWDAALAWSRSEAPASAVASPTPRPPVRVDALPAPAASGAGQGLTHEATPVTRALWPRYVWHYTDDAGFYAMRGEGFNWLTQSEAHRGFPSGAYVTTLDPARNDLDQVAAWLSGRNPWTRQANRPGMVQHWIKLDLEALPPGYELHRVSNVHESTYLIRPPRLTGGGHAGDVPGALPAVPLRGIIQGVGHRPKS
ncbi:hypothetical protein P3W24_16970 [Luteibacter sp. PPL201]|uniref:Dermonecrotic toxin N-terminal domain-containing protein n=1 Tax=Luteibacter sahnii TaxID=3021977 RepID=A0ABT6BFP2_9GAMM